MDMKGLWEVVKFKKVTMKKSFWIGVADKIWGDLC